MATWLDLRHRNPERETAKPSNLNLSKEETSHLGASQDIKTTTRFEEYESLFKDRPNGLDEKATWLLRLEEKRGEKWYNDFSHWYREKLYHRPLPSYNPDFLDSALGVISKWEPTDSIVELVTDRLAHACTSNTPDFYFGRYNGHTLGLVVNGSALDPPTAGIETFDSLGVQYAHLDMFAGLRIREWSKDDLCVVTLGNIYASTTEIPSETTPTHNKPHLPALENVCDWFDTRFVLTLDITSTLKQTPLVSYYLIYKYEGYDIQHLDDDDKRRFEEPEQKIPLNFCNGSAKFTVAVWKSPRYIFKKDPKIVSNIRLDVVSTKKPSLAVAGYKDEQDPYIPVFPPRDS